MPPMITGGSNYTAYKQINDTCGDLWKRQPSPPVANAKNSAIGGSVKSESPVPQADRIAQQIASQINTGERKLMCIPINTIHPYFDHQRNTVLWYNIRFHAEIEAISGLAYLANPR